MDREELAGVCMRLISAAGEGRALLSESLTALVRHDLPLAKEKMAVAEEYLSQAHKIQMVELVAPQQGGAEVPFDLLLIHAMDILMIAGSEKDMLKTVVSGLQGSAG